MGMSAWCLGKDQRSSVREDVRHFVVVLVPWLTAPQGLP